MSSKQKQRRCSNILLARQMEDRISDLPTCLIVKIISLIPTKDAVATSVLSTRWKHLWTSVTNLDFEDKGKVLKKSEKSFRSFVNRVLPVHDKSCLQRFRLKCYYCYDGSQVNAWIASVLPCNVQELDISVSITRPVLFPSDIFLCKMLVVLKLVAKGKANIPSSISLPNLKTLQLEKVCLSDDVSIVRLFCGCPVLKKLKLKWCIGKDVRVIHIISPTLKTLTLEWLPYNEERELLTVIKYRIVLDTPSLQYFDLIDYVAKGYAVKNMCHLIKANIDIAISEGDDEDDDAEEEKALTDLFNAISQVQSLDLSSRSLHVVSSASPKLLEFSNLTDLEIFFHKKVSCFELTFLLEKLPCLETLKLYLRQGYHDRISFIGFEYDGLIPTSLSFHLKLIEIGGFVGFEEEMEMLEYFLRNAEVLGRLTLHHRPYKCSSGDKENLLKKLKTLPKASTICEVELL